jgi:hypothetical protein
MEAESTGISYDNFPVSDAKCRREAGGALCYNPPKPA